MVSPVCLGVTVQTVRNWRASGLKVMAEKRPHLILGACLIEFLHNRRSEAQVEIDDDQIFCLSCRSAVRPWGMALDYLPISDTRGRLEGLCERRHGTCCRFASKAQLPELAAIFEIASGKRSQAYTNPVTLSQNITSAGQDSRVEKSDVATPKTGGQACVKP